MPSEKPIAGDSAPAPCNRCGLAATRGSQGGGMARANDIDASVAEFGETANGFLPFVGRNASLADVAPFQQHAVAESHVGIILANPPFGGKAVAHRSPQEIMHEIAALDAESAEVPKRIKALLYD